MFSSKMIGITKVTKCIWLNASYTQRLPANIMRFSTSNVLKGKLDYCFLFNLTN